jgi:hypothetical protein
MADYWGLGLLFAAATGVDLDRGEIFLSRDFWVTVGRLQR